MSLPVDGSLIILQFDWKENIQRGRGPEEDSSVVHNLQSTAVFGACIRYYSNEYKQNAIIYIPVLTDVLNKTAEAANSLISFVLEELRKLEFFQPVFQRAKCVIAIADVGRHFRSEVFLEYMLIDFVKTHGKTVLLQGFRLALRIDLRFL